MGVPQPALSPGDPVCPVWRLPRVGLLHPPLFLLLNTGRAWEENQNGCVETHSTTVPWMQQPGFVPVMETDCPQNSVMLSSSERSNEHKVPRVTALRMMDRVHLETWLVPLEVRCTGVLTCQLSLGEPTGVSGPTCVCWAWAELPPMTSYLIFQRRDPPNGHGHQPGHCP